MLRHRAQCAWTQIHLFRHALTDKHVNIGLRLRLFDSVVTSSALYGLTTTPLSAHRSEKLAATQRKMIRCMVGYTKLPEDTWEDMYSKIKSKMADALARTPIRDWQAEVKQQKTKHRTQLQQDRRSYLVCEMSRWDPQQVRDSKLPEQPRRGPGRPRVKWYS